MEPCHWIIFKEPVNHVRIPLLHFNDNGPKRKGKKDENTWPRNGTLLCVLPLTKMSYVGRFYY